MMMVIYLSANALWVMSKKSIAYQSTLHIPTSIQERVKISILISQFFEKASYEK